MGWWPGERHRTGEDPDRKPDEPDGSSAPNARGGPAGFARGGVWDSCLPGPELAAAIAAVAGSEWRCPGAGPDELIGVMRRAAALESWAAAVKLGVIRELIRQDDLPVPGCPRHGDLPDQWSESLNHELALALASSVPSAEKTALTAWELGARLPGIAGLLADGTLTFAKARLITETFQLLSDADAARAEALILPQLTGATGKTFGQIVNLANRAAVEADPGLAERRRRAAVKHASRVQMFREQSGAAALCGRDLPPDETLAAFANVTARADEYKESGVFPGARMDQLRAAAYLDLIRGMSADARVALGYLSTDPDEPGAPGAPDGPDEPGAPGAPGGPDGPDGPDDNGGESSGGECGGECGGEAPSGAGSGGGGPGPGGSPASDACGASASDDGPAASDGDGRAGGNVPPAGRAPGACDPGGGPVPPAFQGQAAGRPVLADLVIPLATLLGFAARPGEAYRLGVLDPDLCRDLAALAAASPHSQFCITVTDSDGIAIGHGCARRRKPAPVTPGQVRAGTPRAPAALPARVNLTITADRLSVMLRRGSGGPSSLGHLGGARGPGGAREQQTAAWALTRRDAGRPGSPNGSQGTGRAGPRGARAWPDDPGWCGTWTLMLPGGGQLAVRIEPVPTYQCDHRHESHVYQPNGTLRHLVQVRDYVCTFPSCSRHARESDFEHRQPYDKGGRTCSCNAGARSRQCHRVKQSPGWNVAQPKPGWHIWTTPSGRTYAQAPHRYPV